MKRAGSFLILCAILILTLTACGMKPADSATENTRTRAVMDEGKQMMLDAKYYAAPNGRVRGTGKDILGDSMRSATNKVTDDIRGAGDATGNARNDMAHN